MLRTNAPCSIPGSFMSSTYNASPLTKRSSSARASARPIHGAVGARTVLMPSPQAGMSVTALAELLLQPVRRERPVLVADVVTDVVAVVEQHELSVLGLLRLPLRLLPRDQPVEPSGDREEGLVDQRTCLLYTSPSPRDGLLSRM